MTLLSGLAPNVGPDSGLALLKFFVLSAAAGVHADKYSAHDGGGVMIDNSIRAIFVCSRDTLFAFCLEVVREASNVWFA